MKHKNIYIFATTLILTIAGFCYVLGRAHMVKPEPLKNEAVTISNDGTPLADSMTGSVSSEELPIAEPEMSDSYVALHTCYDFYCSYPSKATAEIVESIVAEIDEDSFLCTIKEELLKDSSDISVIKEILASSDWKENYFLSNGLLSASYVCKSEDCTVYLTTGASSSTIVVLDASGIHSFIAEGGKTTTYKEDDSGNFTGTVFSDNSEILQNISGTFSDGKCVGTLTIEQEGIVYTGHFDEEGHSTEEQKSKKKTIYALAEDQNKCLYTTEKAGSFSVTADFLNLFTGKYLVEDCSVESVSEDELLLFEEAYKAEKEVNPENVQKTFSGKESTVTAIEKEAAPKAPTVTKPTETPETVPEGTPTPAPSPENPSVTPNPTPSPEPAPTPTPTPEPTPNPGDGEDLSWTDDVL